MKTSYKNELVVIKVGSSTLEKRDSIDWISLDDDSFRRIAAQTSELADRGAKVAIVSSGAVSAGYAYSCEERTHKNRQDTLEKQRYACLGQAPLMLAWQEAFQNSGKVAQLVFTKRELETDEGIELAAVSGKLLEHGDIIIANENDALSHAEITFGDNDTLAARFAGLLHASGRFARTRLIILSDIHGVYGDRNDASTVIKEISSIDAVSHLAGGTGSIGGTGGMRSKFDAARICQGNGMDMHIAHGREVDSVLRTLRGTTGTRFTIG